MGKAAARKGDEMQERMASEYGLQLTGWFLTARAHERRRGGRNGVRFSGSLLVTRLTWHVEL